MNPYAGKVQLGQAKLLVSRLGIGCSYGIGTSDLLRAYEKGINYFYFGTLRRSAMAKAVHEIAPRDRTGLVVAIQSYARWPTILRKSVEAALRKLKLDFADILILGKTDRFPSKELVDEVVRLKEAGLFHHLVISAHRRRMFAEYIPNPLCDAIMVRYNAANTGAEKDVFPLLPANNRPGVVCYTATRWGTLLKAGESGRIPSASDCYRFVLRQPCVDICLCGPKNGKELDEALKVLNLPSMSDEEAEWICRVGAKVYEQQAHNFLLRKLIFD